MPLTTIVVPCYNEAERLDANAFRKFARRNPEITFVFVNDGSADATASVLDALHADAPRSFAALHLPANRGKAEAVRTGILHALGGNADFVGYWDADLATPLRAIRRFARIFTLRPSVTMVIGSRVKLLGRRIERRPARHYLGRVFATFSSLMLQLPVYDTQCGATLFRVTPELRAVFEREFRSRWLFDVEVLWRFTKLRGSRTEAGELIYEAPLDSWRDVSGSKLGVTHILRVPFELLQIWWAYRRDAGGVSIRETP